MANLPDASCLRILSIDGGGMKGYTSLLILKRILRAMKVDAKKEGIDLNDEPRPCDIFDLIVGTSTGGLIAIMLGRLHMTVDQCIEQYGVLGKRIFGKTQWTGQMGRLGKGMFNRPFYDTKILQDAVRSILKLPEIKMLAGRGSQMPESWWTENRIVLNKSQLRYGLLVPAAAGGNSSTFGVTSTSVLTDRKGKSRALRGFVNKFSKTAFSNSHS